MTEGKKVRATLNSVANGDHVLITVRTSDLARDEDREGVDLCLCLDVSGSTGDDAKIVSQTGVVERHGLSILDIIKHAVRTIAHSLCPRDRLGVVTFSTAARVALPLTPMDAAGVSAVEKVLDSQRPDEDTNLWAGVSTALDVMNAVGTGTARTSAVFLLTDGVPTRHMIPEGGHGKAMRAKLDVAGGSLLSRCSLSTFGFGYKLDSDLLVELASIGQGAYVFVPDASFVGTAFVNATAALLATAATGAKLSVEAAEGVKVIGTLGGCSSTMTSWGCEVRLGSLRFGEERHVLVRLGEASFAPGKQCLNARLGFFAAGGPGGTETVVTAEGVTREAAGGTEVDSHIQRLRAYDVLTSVARTGGDDLAMAQRSVRDLIASVSRSPSAATPRVAALLEDLRGQVTQSVSRPEWFKKWGKFYVSSLARAHLLEVVANFKDPGLQVYAGRLFSTQRDRVDDIFLALPPPKPSNYSPDPAPPGRPPVQLVETMAAYDDASAGCFATSCQVLMADGSSKPAGLLRKGDSVATSPDGTTCSRVVCLVETACRARRADLVHIDGGLLITAWHPIVSQGMWVFPTEIAKPEPTVCPSVCTVVLEDRSSSVIVCGTPCAALGHGAKGDIREHSFFGTDTVIEVLSRAPSWSSGHVHVRGVTRDSTSGQVDRLVLENNM